MNSSILGQRAVLDDYHPISEHRCNKYIATGKIPKTIPLFLARGLPEWCHQRLHYEGSVFLAWQELNGRKPVVLVEGVARLHPKPGKLFDALSSGPPSTVLAVLGEPCLEFRQAYTPGHTSPALFQTTNE